MKIADRLDGLELFKDFSYPQLESIGRFLLLERVAKGEVLFLEGEAGNRMLILLSGSISIYKGGEHGRHLLSHETRGRVVGEMSVLDHEVRSATCIAETDCELVSLSSEGLKKMAHDNPSIAYQFMFCLSRLLSRRLRRVTGMMADYLGN